MEPARSDSLTPGRSYALTNPLGRSNKAFLQLKLTDSFLKSLEQIRTAKSKDKRLRINFVSESGGVINFGQGDGAERYGFTVSIMDQQGSVECVFDQHRSKQLSVLGSVSHKMMICGRSDSYENTKTAMVEAEIEKGKKKVKEIELGPKGGARRQKKHAQIKPSVPHRKPMIVSSGMRNGGVIAPAKSSTTTGSSNKSLRSRIIHLLALKPHNKLELDAKLGKDGKGAQNFSPTLSQVANFKDNKYHLKKYLYSEVQIDTWPLYSEQDKRLVRRRLSTVETPLTSATSSPAVSPPKETPLPSMGLPLSRPSPFKVVNARVHQQQRDQKEKEQKVRIDQQKPMQTTAQATLRKRSSASSLVSGNSEKKMKPNGLDNSVSSNSSSNPLGSMNAMKSLKSSPPREPATEKITDDRSESDSKDMAAGISDDSLSPDYERQYTKITSEEMRSRYKTDFNAEYPKYQQLQRLLDPFQNKFKKLAEELNSLQQDSPRYQKLEKKIEQECEKWENDERLQKVQRERDALYDKLSYIKQLVVQYDHNNC